MYLLSFGVPKVALALSAAATSASGAALATASSWVGIITGIAATVVSIASIAGLARRRKRRSTAPKRPPDGCTEEEMHDYWLKLDQWVADGNGHEGT